MSRRLVAPALILAGVLLTAAVVYAVTLAPGVFPSDQCEVKIVGIKFETKVEADNVSMTESDPTKFRYAVVTFRIEKPADKDITLAAADVTLHYRREGGEFDISPCEAIATFTTGREEDRALNSSPSAGPGWTKVTTGTASRKSTTIYSDVVFGKVEKDARGFWLSIGQPATPMFSSEGWTP